MVKERVKQGAPKATFKHFTHIPQHLRDNNIDTIELANDFQEGYMEGRKKGFMHESYGYIMWYSKYFWSVIDKKWKVREVGKPICADSKQKILENMIIILRLVKTPLVKWGYEYVEECSNKIKGIVDGQKRVEATLKVEGTPEVSKKPVHTYPAATAKEIRKELKISKEDEEIGREALKKVEGTPEASKKEVKKESIVRMGGELETEIKVIRKEQKISKREEAIAKEVVTGIDDPV